jgi:hypothetical protein
MHVTEGEVPATGASYRPDGTWSCTRDGVTRPCGDCDGCRQVQAQNAAEAEDTPPGMLLSVGSQGGFAVPRQLAGRIGRR